MNEINKKEDQLEQELKEEGFSSFSDDEPENIEAGRINQEKPPGVFETIGLFVFDFLKIFIIAVAIIIPVRWFLFQPFVVTGDSMQPNFVDGDYLIIDEVSYRFRDIDRGEVVVLRFPNDPSQFFIKRVVGLPGERVIIQNGQVAVTPVAENSNQVLTESYLPERGQTYGNIDLTLDRDEYFVLGDNRLSSSDSRLWGPVDEQLIIGRVIVRAFPVDSFKFFQSPNYQLVSP